MLVKAATDPTQPSSVTIVVIPDPAQQSEWNNQDINNAQHQSGILATAPILVGPHVPVQTYHKTFQWRQAT